MLTLKNLTVFAGDKEILHDLSLEFKPGRVYVLMGPNGSGKSTLAHALLGDPALRVKRGSQILMRGKNITRLEPDKRARLGLFLSFQNPLPLPGVSVKELLRLALEKKHSPLELNQKIVASAKELHIKDELLTRSLNEDFSGGEKKRLEALQAVMLEPRVAIFDELDTGVDVDAIKIISRFLKRHLPKEVTVIFITHSAKMAKYIRPDHVLVMKAGHLVKTGDAALVKQVEAKGFDQF